MRQTGPLQAATAARMRAAAQQLDKTHPETTAAGHVRDAATTIASGRIDGSKRHLDAAMEVLTPRNLMRHGILDDQGHTTAKQAMHAVHRLRLAVMDIEDIRTANQAEQERRHTAQQAEAESKAKAQAIKTGAFPQPTESDANGNSPPQSPVGKAQPNADAAPGSSASAGSQPPVSTAQPAKPAAVPARTTPAKPRPPAAKGAQLAFSPAESAIELGWRDAWRTERRGRGGMWSGLVGDAASALLQGAAANPRNAGAISDIASTMQGITQAENSIGSKIGMKLPKGAEDVLRGVTPETGVAAVQKLTGLGMNVHDAATAVAKTLNLTGGQAAISKAQQVTGRTIQTANQRGAVELAFNPAEPRDAHGWWIGKRVMFRDQASGKGVTMHGTVVSHTRATGRGRYDRLVIKTDKGDHVTRDESTVKVIEHKIGDAVNRAVSGSDVAKGMRGSMGYSGDQAAIDLAYDPAQPRDMHGRWAHTPGYRSARLETSPAAYGARERASGLWGAYGTFGDYTKAQQGMTSRQRVAFRHATLMGKSPGEALAEAKAVGLPQTATAEPGPAQRRRSMYGGRTLGQFLRQRTRLNEAQNREYVRQAGLGKTPGQALAAARKMTIQAANERGAIELSAQTARLAATPHPNGRPGGPGLYDKKGNKHSDYFEQIVHALMTKRGMSQADASRIAWGALRKWTRGGGKVHPEVRAAAGRALGQEQAAKLSGDQLAIELVGPEGFIHGWIFVGKGGSAEHIAALRSGADTIRSRYGDEAGDHVKAAADALERKDYSGARDHLTSAYSAVASRSRAGGINIGSDAHKQATSDLQTIKQHMGKTQEAADAAQAAQPRRHHLFSSWEMADRLIELSAGGPQWQGESRTVTGQFGAGGQGGAAAGPKGKAARQAKRAQLIKKAAGIRSQIKALEAMLPHKSSSKAKSKSSTPAKKGAAATSAKAAAAAKASSTKAKTAAKHTMSTATIHAKISALRAELTALMHQIHQLANDHGAIELSYRDAWRTELRGKGGQFARTSGSGAAHIPFQSGRVSRDQWRAAHPAALTRPLPLPKQVSPEPGEAAKQDATRKALLAFTQHQIETALTTPPQQMTQQQLDTSIRVVTGMTHHDVARLNERLEKVVTQPVAGHVKNHLESLRREINRETQKDAKHALIFHVAMILGAVGISLAAGGLGVPAGIAAIIAVTPALAQELRDWRAAQQTISNTEKVSPREIEHTLSNQLGISGQL